MTTFARARYRLTPIAATDGRFLDFAPYVASINDDGLVAFQAALHGGGSGVFTGDGATITGVTDPASGPVREVTSHPDLNGSGEVCFYGALAPGERGVFGVRSGVPTRLADAHGPLGPTMNEAGAVAYRAPTRSGQGGIFTVLGGLTEEIARTGERFGEFHGLPVIERDGRVVFRADLRTGGQGVYVNDGPRTTAIAETGAELDSIAPFPTMNAGGTVAFCAARRDGRAGVFLSTGGPPECIIESGRGFESFRGVLINSAGPVALIATPAGGRLGVFTGPAPGRDGLLSIGSPLMGSRVAEFALNPVSVNEAGQLAMRARLEDQRQYILRADPG